MLLAKCSKNNKNNLGQNEGLHQGLVNLDFDDNKIKFDTNDYASSVIRQEYFQSCNYKDKIKSKRNQ